MQSEDEILTQLPPPIKELDQAMGATQLNDDEDDKEKTAPPSPSLVEKKNHLPPLKKIPYPMDILDLEELANAPVQEWNMFLPKRGNQLEFFHPELQPGMADSMEPNTYWAIGDGSDKCEYHIWNDFIEPDEITKNCKVGGSRGYLEIDINESSSFPKITIVIIFDVDKLAPHEALVQASQQYDEARMARNDWPYALNTDTLQCVLFADTNCFLEWRLNDVKVKFNSPALAARLEDNQVVWMDRIKNTLWEYVFIHIWSHFFINVEQPTPEVNLFYQDLMVMKMIFLDKMEKVTFDAEVKDGPPHLEAFEHWFALNGMVRLMYLKEKGLTWKNHLDYLKNPMGDRAALEAAGIKGITKWVLVGEKGWKQEAKKRIAEVCGEPKLKKQCKENDNDDEEEEIPKPKEPFSAYEKVGRNGRNLRSKKRYSSLPY